MLEVNDSAYSEREDWTYSLVLIFIMAFFLFWYAADRDAHQPPCTDRAGRSNRFILEAVNVAIRWHRRRKVRMPADAGAPVSVPRAG